MNDRFNIINMRINYLFIICSLLVYSVVITGCKKESEEPEKEHNYAHEYKYERTGGDASPNTWYSCTDYRFISGASAAQVEEVVFSAGAGGNMRTLYVYVHTDKTCAELGYTAGNSSGLIEVFGALINPSGYHNPGSSGYFSGNTGGGGGGGGNLPDFCDQPYSWSYTDPQVAPFCQMAYLYRCQGFSLTSDQVKSNCTTLENWRKLDPSIPICPYCQ